MRQLMSQSNGGVELTKRVLQVEGALIVSEMVSAELRCGNSVYPTSEGATNSCNERGERTRYQAGKTRVSLVHICWLSSYVASFLSV